VQVWLPAKAVRTAFALIALGSTYVCAVGNGAALLRQL